MCDGQYHACLYQSLARLRAQKLFNFDDGRGPVKPNTQKIADAICYFEEEFDNPKALYERLRRFIHHESIPETPVLEALERRLNETPYPPSFFKLSNPAERAYEAINQYVGLSSDYEATLDLESLFGYYQHASYEADRLSTYTLNLFPSSSNYIILVSMTEYVETGEDDNTSEIEYEHEGIGMVTPDDTIILFLNNITEPSSSVFCISDVKPEQISDNSSSMIATTFLFKEGGAAIQTSTDFDLDTAVQRRCKLLAKNSLVFERIKDLD